MPINVTQGHKSAVALVFILVLSFFFLNYIVVSLGIVFLYFSIFEIFFTRVIVVGPASISINGIKISRNKIENIKYFNFIFSVVLIEIDNKYRIVIDSWGYSSADVELVYEKLMES